MPQILGQERAAAILDAALRGERMHHAWIFHGPAGVGKATTAIALAQTLLCHAPAHDATGKLAPCGSCESCRLLQSGGAHPDLIVITKELAAASEFRELRNRKLMNIPLDLLRERMLGGWIEGKYVEPVVGKTPLLRHGKVFILDEAELLDATGHNALLKTLEEPPPGTHIFLITAHEDRLLPTIRSRCQRVPFAPLSDAVVEQWVRDRMPEMLNPIRQRIEELRAKTRPSKDDQAVIDELERRSAALSEPDRVSKWIVPLSRGSIGMAQTVVVYGLDEWAEAITPLVAAAASGRPVPELGKTMAELVETYAQRWVAEHAGASKDAANKAGVKYMLGLVGEVARRKLHELASQEFPDAEAAELAATPWLGGIDLLQLAQRELESNVSIPLLLDNLAIQWPVRTTGAPVPIAR